MSKKRTKSGAGSAGVQRWEQAILTTPFCEEDKWNSSIALVIGNELDDYKHLEHLAPVVNSGIRRLFSIITKDDLYEQVKELGNPKGKKPKETPQHYEICEPCKAYLDTDDDIPLPLLAKLIKFRLLDIKQKDLKRRDSEKKGSQDKEKSGKKGDKGKDRSKSPAKGKSGKKTPEPPSAKVDSKLRKRGEEDQDSKYIDDEPDDGPQHYIILSGFHQPHLLTHLADLSLNVDSIVKVSSESYARFAPDSAETDDVIEKDEKTLAAEAEERRVKKRKARELKQFWKDILLLMQGAPSLSSLHDVARLEYIVNEDKIPENLEDNDQKTLFGTALFEDIACMMYDLLDAKRQWKNYIDNLKLLQIPVHGQPVALSEQKDSQSQAPLTPAPAAAPPKLDGAVPPEQSAEFKFPTGEVDMRYYNDLMSSIPQESVSVGLVMHCMLEQIVASEEEKEPPSETPRPPRIDGLEDSVAEHITSMAFGLALSQDEHEILSKDFDAPKVPERPPKQPLLLSYHDNITRRLNHLKPVDKFDVMAAELGMLGYLPAADLHKFARPSEKGMKDRAARLQELLHFSATGGLTQLEIEHALQQFVLECVDLSHVDKDGNVTKGGSSSQHDIPWDDPYPLFKGMIPTAAQIADQMEAEKTVTVAEPGTKSPAKGDAQPPTPMVTPSPQPSDEASRPNSGILKTSRHGSSLSRHSNVSVHFKKDDDEADDVPEMGEELNKGEELPAEIAVSAESLTCPLPAPVNETPDGVDADLMELENTLQKRVLDQWCFAEHHEPKVLMQVMSDALYTHPYIDMYYHKRDDSMLVVLHNPQSSLLQSRSTWHAELHSNVGFRNYLEHVAESIEDWTRDEEAKYQASILAQEVDQIVKEAESSSRPSSAKGKKKDRSKSPKKSPSRGGKSPSRSSSAERPSSSNTFIRQGSLKAWKEEQDKIKAEEEEKERQKEEKRIKSAQKKAAKEQMDEKESKGKRPGSRTSSKSRMSKEEGVLAQDTPSTEDPRPPERFWPFTGYDVGNNLIHASGELYTMFPADGGQIRMEKTEFIQGTVSVKTSVLKDGHSFVVHVIDPKSDKDEDDDDFLDQDSKEEAVSVSGTESPDKPDDSVPQPEERGVEEIPAAQLPNKPCVGAFGSFSAQYNDGLSLSLSTYGHTGAAENGGKYEPAPYIAPPPRSPTPTAKEGSPTKGKKGGKDKAATPEPAAAPESEVSVTKEDEAPEVVEEEPVPHQPFQQLCLSSPDGLNVSYYLESAIGIRPERDEDRRLLVKQSYPNKTRGVQPCEAVRKLAMEEVSRVTSMDGTVVKTKTDGSTVVMYADGRVSELCTSSPLLSDGAGQAPPRTGSAKSDRDTPGKKAKPSRRSARKTTGDAPTETTEEEPSDKGFWIYTYANGERSATKVCDGSKVPTKDCQVCVASDPQTGQTMHTREDHVIQIYYPDGGTLVEHADGTRITVTFTDVPGTAGDNSETGEAAEMTMQRLTIVTVECPGYATLKFDSSSGRCSTELGSGASIQATTEGAYDLYHQDGSCLHIEEDSTAVYFPRPNGNVDMPNPNQQLQYIMRHSADVLCETVDNMGNTFSVSNFGETNVVLANGQEAVAVENDEDGSKEVQEIHTKDVMTYKEHAPRFFILHHDGSGSELLRYQDIADYVAEAEDDLATAILMDALPDYPGVVGITVLKPYLTGLSESWIKSYERESIIPAGLTSRDLHTLPPREFKSEGPKFGTNVGQGLAVGSVVRGSVQPPLLKCPSVLQIRQILQYKPVAGQLREKLGSSLRQYADHFKARLRQSEAVKVQDPRSDDEKQLAMELQALARTPAVSSHEPEPANLPDDVKGLYEQATAPAVTSPPPAPQPKRSKSDWERDMRERAEEVECRKALRNHDVPKYFDSELGKAFLLSQAPDMDALSKQLSGCSSKRQPPVSSQDRSPASPPDSQSSPESQNLPSDSVNAPVSDSAASTTSPPAAMQATTASSPSPVRGPSGNTPSALRPGNPTPAHATGEGSPAPVRPTNPTPVHATKTVLDRPVNPTPKDDSGPQSATPSNHTYSIIHEQPAEEASGDDGGLVPSANSDLVLTKSLAVDVIGEPRKQKVRVPAYLNNSRPSAVINKKFALVEDPVRRQTNTLSITGATLKGRETLMSMRGFDLLPEYVDFGVLCEGHTYSYKVHMKNTGVDGCRFRVKHPPPSTGIKVYYKAGPVAAGMKTELEIEIYAIAAGVEGDRGVGTISHTLEIVTETHHLYLPIRATVLTAYDYDNKDIRRTRGGKALGVTLVSKKPPGGSGIIRPRKTTQNTTPRTEKVC